MSTKTLNIRPEDLTGGNPRAASVRLEGKSLSQAYGQRRHDWRIGPQPKYVDPARKSLNRPLIEPRPVSQIRDEVLKLRTARGAKRAMKSNAAVVTAGIITFGAEAQEMFLTLTIEQQDAAFRELAQAVADRLDTSLEALMVHCDESAIHAHFELRACNRSGIPLAKATRPALMIEISKPARASCRPFRRNMIGFRGRSKLWKSGPPRPSRSRPRPRMSRAGPQSGLRRPISVFWPLRGAKRA